MPNTLPSPYMGMPVPVPGVDPGPDWAQNIVASLGIADAHDHSTGKGAPITGPIIGSPISDAAITASTVDSTPVGATTPSTGAFSTVAIGAGAPAFRMQRFIGSIAAGAGVALLPVADYAAFLGAIGTTTYSGGSTLAYALGTGKGTSSSTNVIYLTLDSSGNVELTNYDSANQNAYDVTLFYVP